MLRALQTTMSELVAAFDADERGATATEYIILLILVACVVIAIVKAYGGTVSEKFEDSADAVRKDVKF